MGFPSNLATVGTPAFRIARARCSQVTYQLEGSQGEGGPIGKIRHASGVSVSIRGTTDSRRVGAA